LIQSYIHAYKLRVFYSNLIDKNELCFDIGANTGEKSRLFLKTGAKVVAFEPQEECVSRLSKIKRQYKNFDFHTIAIGVIDGVKKLHLSNYSEIATLSNVFVSLYKKRNVQWLDQRDVKTITINTAIQRYGLPYFCKIDIEGYEYEVLSTLQYNIALIEFEVVVGFKQKAIDTITFLDNSHTTYNYTLNEQPFFQLNTWVDLKKITHIIENFSNERLHANIFVRNNLSSSKNS